MALVGGRVVGCCPIVFIAWFGRWGDDDAVIVACVGAVAEKLLFPQEGQILMLVITLLPHASQKPKFTLFSSTLNRCLNWAIGL